MQSSPGVPASAFVNLITAFSNITVNQASSLIAVVQASPTTPATAFVDLLTSFTVDTSATPATNQAVTPTTPQSTAQTATIQLTNTTSTEKLQFVGVPYLEVESWKNLSSNETIVRYKLHATTNIPSSLDLQMSSHISWIPPLGSMESQQYESKQPFTVHESAWIEIGISTMLYRVRAQANGNSIELYGRFHPCYSTDFGLGDTPIEPQKLSCKEFADIHISEPTLPAPNQGRPPAQS